MTHVHHKSILAYMARYSQASRVHTEQDKNKKILTSKIICCKVCNERRRALLKV